MSRHFSNPPSSSACEGDTSDSFYSHFPNNSQLYTPESSGSQDAIVANSDISETLLSPPPIPSFLHRVGPDQNQGYVLYTHKYNEMERDAFVAWWLGTDYGTKKRINWDTRHQSDCWKQFDQVAEVKTGRPAVMCNQCIAVLDHPANSRHGTSSMNKHMKGVNCRKASRKPNIKQALNHAVMLYLIINSFLCYCIQYTNLNRQNMLPNLPSSLRMNGNISLRDYWLYHVSLFNLSNALNSMMSFTSVVLHQLAQKFLLQRQFEHDYKAL